MIVTRSGTIGVRRRRTGFNQRTAGRPLPHWEPTRVRSVRRAGPTFCRVHPSQRGESAMKLDIRVRADRPRTRLAHCLSRGARHSACANLCIVWVYSRHFSLAHARPIRLCWMPLPVRFRCATCAFPPQRSHWTGVLKSPRPCRVFRSHLSPPQR